MTTALQSFWNQPCRRYRTFQIVFTILTLNFVIPALSYTFAPEVAIANLVEINNLLGGGPYVFPTDGGTHVWRYLAAANVMTLGFMCLLLQVNLRTFFPVLVPLTFMKSFAAICFLVGWFLPASAPFFLGAAVLDSVTSGAFIFFAVRAKREIQDRSDDELYPRPLGVFG